jgi:molybdopterin-guanine dinucleotide biosynthesis protein A
MRKIAPLQGSVCALVVAGGLGSRMGGADKGLQPFRGLPLAQHAIQRLRQQVPVAPDQIAINANRNSSLYAAWGLPLWPDQTGVDLPAFAGPLLGFLAGLRQAQGSHELLLTVPCDSPFFPLDLLVRMRAALEDQGATLAVAIGPQAQVGAPAGSSTVLRPQPVFCLMRTLPQVGDSLQAFLEAGGRKIGAWLASHACAQVRFDQPHDQEEAFANANSLDELHALDTAPGVPTHQP